MAAEGSGNIVRFTYTGEDGQVIPDEATHILVKAKVVHDHAFSSHPNIVEVICHEIVELIEYGAFCECPSLRRVIMPGVITVEPRAFGSCEALEDVECDKLEIVGEFAFFWCESLRVINLPSVRIVHKSAFGICRALTDVKFGGKLERIEEAALLNCESLERITIPLKNGLITTDDIFMECDNLHRVDLIEGEVHATIIALHLEEWRNDMNQEIDSINQILSNAPAGGWDVDTGEDDLGDKAREIRRWIRSVLRRLDHYKTEHHKLLKEATTLLELALWKANLDDNEGGNLANEGVRMTRGQRKRARKEICVTSGASIVIKNVLPFLQLLEQEDDSIIYV